MKKICLLLGLALGGCTSVGTIRSQDVRPLAADQAIVGVSYALPAIQYTIKSTRTLTDCKSGVPAFTIKPTVSATYVAGERFEVDPTNLSSIMKSTSLGLTYQDDNDTLKSFNAAADDKTGDVLADAAKIGVSIASFAASGGTVAVPVTLPAPSPDPMNPRILQFLTEKGKSPGEPVTIEVEFDPTLACTQDAITRLKDHEAKTGELRRLETQLTALNERIAAQKTLASFRNFSPRNVNALITLMEESFDLSAKVAAKRTEVEKAKELLQIETEHRWPEASWKPGDATAYLKGENLPIFDAAGKFGEFCKNFSVSYALKPDPMALFMAPAASPPKGDCNDILLAIAEVSKVKVKLEPVTKRADGGGKAVNMLVPIARSETSDGIFVREPELARLLIEVEDTKLQRWNKLHTDEPRWVPQIGRLRFLQFKSGPFENETLSLALRKDGRLESLTYQTKDAALARLAKAGADIGERAAKAREDAETEYRSDVDRARADAQYARDEAKKNMESITARQNAEIATLDYRINLTQRTRTLLSQQAMSDDAAAERANELAMLNSEIALLRAEKERLELTQVVRNLRQIEAGGGN
jgi:hypothetical protein